ncbi:MAG: dipeptidase [Bacteroidia bacterium]|nr:dipeptidase [Bacteroidia bacterium]
MHPTEWIKQRSPQLIQDLFAFLSFPSVSAQTQHRPDLKATAQWLKAYLEKLGFWVELWGEPPIVHAYRAGPSGAPTALFYGHYDVQPPEPLELWHSPPFSPRIADECIYARGASDDKGQVFIHLAAWQYLIERYGDLPLSIHAVIEGEEETGSETLYGMLRQHGKAWQSDVVVVSDTAFFAEGVPTLTVGLRGLVYTEITVRGPQRDLHSGSFGGVAPNPALALATLLARLKSEDGRIQIPGFYDRVRAPDEKQRRLWRRLPATDEHYQRLMGVSALSGEVGFAPIERISIRPTLDVNGLLSGYTGEGAKTIIPAQATAKVSMRLVPDQDPQAIWESFRQYISQLAPAGVEVEVRLLHEPAPAFETPTDSPYYQAAEQALTEAFGSVPIPVREGGSIPILSHLQRAVGHPPVILMGFGLPTDAVHSPNECFRLRQLWGGLHATIRFYESLSGRKNAT